MRIRIIVDSTADLTPEFKKRVDTVPLSVNFGDEEFIDGVTIDHKTFYEKLVESDVLPTTSHTSPNAFIREFNNAIEARLSKKHPIVICPEAHVWEYYTRIRPFADTSFRFPARLD